MPNKRAKRRSEFNSDWQMSYPWLVLEQGHMRCSTCSEVDAKGVENWVIGGKKNNVYRKDRIKLHDESKYHMLSVDKKKKKSVNPTMSDLVTPVEVFDEGNLTKSMRVVYWLLKKKLPYTKYESLLDLLIESGCDISARSGLPKNSNLRSMRTINEIIDVLAAEVREPILKDLRDSQAWSLLIDETSDISTTEQVVIYAKYLRLNGPDKPPDNITSFLGIVPLDGSAKAEHIWSTVRQFLVTNDIPTDNLKGMGSDGASVMVGKHSGVAALIRKEVGDHVINVHCVAHRLSLALGGATQNTNMVKIVLKTLNDLHSYYSKSPVREKCFEQVQKAFGVNKASSSEAVHQHQTSNTKKLSQAKAVRWLSFEHAVRTVKDVYEPLLISLSKEAKERGCSKGHTFYLALTKWEFVYIIAMLDTVLPRLASLSKLLQSSDLSYSVVGECTSANI